MDPARDAIDLRDLILAHGGAVLAIDGEGRCSFATQAAARFAGSTVEQLAGQDVRARVPMLAEPAFVDALELVRSSGLARAIELRLPGRDAWYECRLVPGPGVVLLYLRSTTDRHQAIAGRREAERRLLLANAAGTTGSFELDLAAGVVSASDEVRAIHGIDASLPTPLPRELTFGLIHPDDRERVQSTLADAAAGDGIYEAEWRIRRASDDELRVVRAAAQVVRDEQGRPTMLIGSIGDVTARARVEEERDRLVAAVEQTSEMVLLLDEAGSVLYANGAASAIAGTAGGGLVGATLERALPAVAEPSGWPERLREAAAGGWAGIAGVARADGSTVELDATLSALRRPDGALRGFVLVGRDVTRERAIATRVAEAQQMEGVGRLAAGIAHDLRNQLTAIRGNADLVDRSLPADAVEARDELAEILRAVDDASSLIEQLLAYGRRQVMEPVALDPDRLVRGMLPMLRQLLGEAVQLDLVPAEPAAFVRADPGQMERVVLNLAVNAGEAMPRGGRLTIETRVVSAAEVPVAIAEPVDACVALAFRDTGTGMDAATMARVFEPFFSTKAPGRGSGMGLSTVQGIVAQLGGGVGVRSAPGRGSTFTVYLPRVPEPRLEAPAVTGDTTGGPERILLVEDDDAVRALARRILVRAGYEVLEADGAPAALVIAAQADIPIDLLLTDVVMPTMPGNELAAQFRRRDPALAVLLMSGYAPDVVATGEGALADAGYLSKPFASDALLAEVRRLLLERRRRELRARRLASRRAD